MKKTVFYFGAVGLVCSSAWAQGARATLGGRVTDAQGAVVPGADVTVTSDETDVKQTTKTNEQGNWIVQFLVPAHYSSSRRRRRLPSVEQNGITLQTGDNKQIDIQLEIGSTTTQVDGHRRKCR